MCCFTCPDRQNQVTGYPEISADHCVHTQLGNASCQACVSACPHEAWILGNNALGLDEAACNGCGLCVPACPTGALQTHFPYTIRHIGGQAVALFGCERSAARGTEACLPCIHSLGIRQLLLLHTSGISRLLLAENDCDTCSNHPKQGLEQRVEQLNILLRERHRPPMRILYRPARVWKAVLKQEALIARGTRLGRRAFLASACSSRILEEQMISMDPLNRPECRTVAPGLLLGTETANQRLPWVPRIKATRCTGCDACIKLCPAEALQLESGESGSCYRMNAPRCSGCGICVDLCTEEAIELQAWKKWEHKSLALSDATCNRCGNEFHVPVDSKLNDTGLCPVCRSSGSKRLFQVLGAA